jgi:CRP/FNR family transcriptional regulator, cyclic AMP receptor protein
MTTHELLLANHPFLRGLAPAHLEALAASAMRREFAPGELIFREGDPANRFYLIQRGHVEVNWRGSNDEPVPVERLGPGETLGWSWLFPPYHAHFEARALETVEAIFLYGTQVRELAERDPEFGRALMARAAGVLLQRLLSAQREVLTLRRELAAAGATHTPLWNEFRPDN